LAQLSQEYELNPVTISKWKSGFFGEHGCYFSWVAPATWQYCLHAVIGWFKKIKTKNINLQMAR
jgi:hypothetical protein